MSEAAPRHHGITSPASWSGGSDRHPQASDHAALGGGPAPEPDAAARLRALTDVTKAMEGALHVDDVLRIASREVHTALPAAVVSLSMWERETGRLRVLVNHGDLAPGEEPYPEHEWYAVSDYPQILGTEHQPRPFIKTVDEDDSERTDHLRRRGRHCALIAPIVFSGRVWGELYIARTAEQPCFVASDADFAAALSAQISAGLARADHLAQVERIAATDPLTGLANRRAVDARLDAAMARYRTGGPGISMAICDLNGLKSINDTHGHAAGDRLLVHFAGMLSAAAAHLPDGLAGRLGGDEFCLIASDIEALVPVAGRLCDQALRLPDARGVACGIASTEAEFGAAGTRSRLFRLADAAQYRAKRNGWTSPVIAGRGPRSELTATLARDPRPVPGRLPPERRRLRGHVVPDPELLLAAVTESVDALVTRNGDVEVADRLAVVADVVARALNAAGWWIGIARAGTDIVRLVRSGAYRAAGDRGDTAPPEAGALSVRGRLDGEDDWLIEIVGDEASLPLADWRVVLRAAAAIAVVDVAR